MGVLGKGSAKEGSLKGEAEGLVEIFSRNMLVLTEKTPVEARLEEENVLAVWFPGHRGQQMQMP